MRRGLLVAMLVLGCAERRSGDLRDDHSALARVLAADDATARAMEPALESLGTGQEAAEATATLRGEATARAGIALRKARAIRAKSAEGRTLRAALLAAVLERQRVVRLALEATESNRPDDVLAAIRAARELEERLVDLDVRIEALADARE